ncbi:TPA: integrase core domain-containing protein [Providencia alcalifaciens]
MNNFDDNQISWYHFQLGKTQQNGFIEHFNGSFHPEFLNTYLFASLSKTRELACF